LIAEMARLPVFYFEVVAIIAEWVEDIPTHLS